MSGQSGKRKFTTKQAVAYFFESNAWKIIQEQQDELISLGDAVVAQYITAMESNSHHKTAGGKKKNKRRKNRTRKMTGGADCSQEETKCGADTRCEDICEDDDVTYTCDDRNFCIPSINAADGNGTLTEEQIKELQNSRISKRLYAKWGILFCIIAAFCANLAMSDDDMWETIQIIWSMLSMEYLQSTDMYKNFIQCSRTERFEANRALDIYTSRCEMSRAETQQAYNIMTMVWAGAGVTIGGLAGLAIGGPGAAWFGMFEGASKAVILQSAIKTATVVAPMVSSAIVTGRVGLDTTATEARRCLNRATEAYHNITARNFCASRDQTGFQTPWHLILAIITLEYSTGGLVSKKLSFLGKKGKQGFDNLADFVVNIFDSVTCQKPLNAEQNRVLRQLDERLANATPEEKDTVCKSLEFLNLQLNKQSRGLAISLQEEMDHLAVQRKNRTQLATLRMKEVARLQDLLTSGHDFTTKQLTNLQKQSTTTLTAARAAEKAEKTAAEKAEKTAAATAAKTASETKKGGKRNKKSRKKKSRKKKSKQKKTTHKRRN